VEQKSRNLEVFNSSRTVKTFLDLLVLNYVFRIKFLIAELIVKIDKDFDSRFMLYKSSIHFKLRKRILKLLL
jgi:hypothetical protein